MKKRIRKTGEIVDVIGFFNPDGERRNPKDQVYYIPAEKRSVGGVAIEWEMKSGLNFCLDFEDVEEEPANDIDWEGVRIKAAIEAVQVFASVYDRSYKDTAKMAVSQADALIAELKKGGKDES